MNRIISTGSTYRIYGEDLKTYEKLPAQIYSVSFFKNVRFLFGETCRY